MPTTNGDPWEKFHFPVNLEGPTWWVKNGSATPRHTSRVTVRSRDVLMFSIPVPGEGNYSGTLQWNADKFAGKFKCDGTKHEGKDGTAWCALVMAHEPYRLQGKWEQDGKLYDWHAELDLE